MRTIGLADLKHLLFSATAHIKEAQDELTDIDSRFGDADHGITMTKIANAIEAAMQDNPTEGQGARGLLRAASDAVLTVNGGSAGPLWCTLLEGMADAAPERDAIGVDDLKAAFQGGLEALGGITTAKVGDKTLMDALIPAVEAIAAFDDGEIETALRAAKNAAVEGADKSADFISKFGRAKSYKEKTIGTRDAGAVSMQHFFIGLYEGAKELTSSKQSD